MRLSKNFTLDEFTRSGVAARCGIDNTPPPEVIERLKETAAMMERIRAFLWQDVGYECPIQITSGYRCAELNARIGSKPTSHHILGAAADWVAPTAGTPVSIFERLKPRVAELKIGQLILEYPKSGGWIHSSVLEVPAGRRVMIIGG